MDQHHVSVNVLRRTGGILAVAGVFLLYLPLFLLFIREQGPSDLDLRQYLALLGRTTVQAGISTVCALILGIPGAFFLARTKIWGRAIIRAFSLLPFVLPPILVLWGFILMWGNNGLLNQWLFDQPRRFLYSLPAIIAVHAFYNFGICMRLISVVWERVNYREEEAARTLGASAFHAWRTVTLPQLLPTIRSAAALTFILCFTSFAVVMMVGGGPVHATLEVALYRLLRTQYAQGVQVALLQSGVLLGISLLLMSGRSVRHASVVHTHHFDGPAVRVGGAVYLLVIVLFCVLPLGLVAFTAMFPPMNLRGGTASWSMLGPPLGNSLLFSLVAGIISVLLGGGLALWLHRRRMTRALGVLFLLPLSISPFTMTLAYMRVLGTRSILVVCIHVLLSLPLVVYVLYAVLGTMRSSWKEGARSLGASPSRVVTTIIVPLILPGVLVALFLAMALSLGELNAALVFTAADRPTIPVVMYQLFSQYRILASIRAGFLLLMLALGIYAIIERWGRWVMRRL